jgi:hypothetical protein
MVDYRLFVRKGKSKDAVCESVLFRTEFGREKAWGLSKFTTMEQLIKEGGYDRATDSIHFGCLIIPADESETWGKSSLKKTGTSTMDTASVLSASTSSK